jgi:hypothetical protein
MTGTGSFSGDPGNVQTSAQGVFTVENPSAVSIKMLGTKIQFDTGMGNPNTFGVDETYLTLLLTMIGEYID